MALALDQLKAQRAVPLPGDHLCVALVPGTQQAWVGSSDGKVRCFDLAEEKPQPVVIDAHRSYVSGAVLAGTQLITSSWDRKLTWWDTEKRQPIRSAEAHAKWIRRLALTPDAGLLASIGDDMALRVWDAVTGKLVRALWGFERRLPRYDYPNKLYTCAFSADAKLLAAADELCRVVVWETATGQEVARFDAPAFFKADWDRNNHPYGGLRCLAFAHDGKSLALAGMQNTDVAIINGHLLVQVVDWATGKITHEFKTAGANSQYETLHFHPQGDWLAAGIGGGSKTLLHFFDLAQQRLLREVPSQMPTFGLALADSADAIVTVGRGRIIRWA